MAFIGQGATNICKIFLTEYQVINELTGHQLWSWGGLGVGCSMLGDNSTTLKSSPVQTVSSGTNWKIPAAQGGLKTDGTLWGWGPNNSGGLGDGTTVNSSSPVQTISAGSNWAAIGLDGQGGIKTDGTLWSWGNNPRGDLGDNSVVLKSSPVQTVAGGTNWKIIAKSKGNGNGAAIKTDGTLWTWGYNGFGQLGNNALTAGSGQSSPVQTISSATNWKSISIGTNFMSAIKTDGTLWSWGCGAGGVLGNDSGLSRSSPVQTVAGGSNWKCVEALGNLSVAIKTDGTLWTWGCNTNGQLGDNTTVTKSSPVQTVSAGSDWRMIGGSNCTPAAIKSNGILWAWGFASQGRLGDNTTVPKSSPVQVVSGGTNWRSLSSMSNNGQTAALRLFSGYDF